MMLKRRRRIQKYINALKLKKKGLTAKDLEQLKLQNQTQKQNQAKKSHIRQAIGVSIPKLDFNQQEGDKMSTEERPLWEDHDEQIQLGQRNVFKKLQLETETTEKQYEERLRKFYNSKYTVNSWAVQGQGEREVDINDLLNHQEVYAHSLQKREGINIEFVARTTQHHDSVVTGIDWKGQIVASCGLDQKLKLWSLRADEFNPQLRLKLEKDVYTEGHALSNCYFRDDQIILGTNRQNYLVINCDKWSINRVSSSFLNQHRTFQNLRLSNDKNRVGLFSQNKISILNKYNSFQGDLIAGQSLVDVQLPSQNKVLAISKDFIFEWDIRTWKLINQHRFFNSFTKLCAQNDLVAVGNKLGILTLLSRQEDQLKTYAQVPSLVTHITQIKGNKRGDLIVECSKWKANAVRLIDVNRGRVISGWPAVNTKIKLPTVAGFSENDQLSIANTHGYINFFKISQNA